MDSDEHRKGERRKLPCFGTPCLMCQETNNICDNIDKKERRVTIERRNVSGAVTFRQEKGELIE